MHEELGSGRYVPTASRELNYRKANTSPDPQGTGTQGKLLPPRWERQASEHRRPGFLEGRLSSILATGRGPKLLTGGRWRLVQTPLRAAAPGTRFQEPTRCCEIYLQEVDQVPPENVRKSPSGFWQGDRKEPVLNSPEHPPLKVCPRGNPLNQSLTDPGAWIPSSGPSCHPGRPQGREKAEKPLWVHIRWPGLPITGPQNTSSLPTAPAPQRTVCSLPFPSTSCPAIKKKGQGQPT